MRIFRKLDELPSFHNAVITIGSFDGVHLGHQQILKRVKALAKAHGGESVVVTFDPHPRLVIYPKDNSLQLISTVEEKIALFEAYGVDHLVVVPFTVGFSQLQADEYIEKFLVKHFNPKCIVIGYDHRFGLNRQGNIEYLRWSSSTFGYEVQEIEKHTIDAIAISSTKIRKALNEGKIKLANQLLGHEFTLIGKVVRGEQIGRKIGYPTANLQVSNPNKLIPLQGIYAVKVAYQSGFYHGMLYIGTRPTIAGANEQTIEVNIFDFNQEIYGAELKLHFLAFLREDMAFGSLDALSEQMSKDKEAALEAITMVEDQQTSGPEGLAIVILNYNGVTFLKQFLPKVIQTVEDRATVIIADNGSTDESISLLRNQFPEVQVIELSKNYGFAQGYNEALKQVDAKYFLLLNSDIEVAENWLDPLVQWMDEHPTTGACQPKIIAQTDRGKFEYAGAAGGWIDYLGYPFCRGRVFDHTEFDEGQYDHPTPIFWATGAAMLVRGDLFEALGGFDGRYFAHSEEIDLCWRIQRAGYQVYAIPSSRVFHVGGGTLQYQSARKAFLNFRNSLFTITKNETFGKLLWLVPARLILDFVAGLLFLSQGKLDHIRAIIDAHWYFFGQFGNVWRQRKVDRQRILDVTKKENRSFKGQYLGSIVFDFYVLGKKRFSKIISGADRHEAKEV